MFCNFATKSVWVMQYAQEEARNLHHKDVNPEHILLGLLKVGKSAHFFQELNIAPDSCNLVRSIAAETISKAVDEAGIEVLANSDVKMLLKNAMTLSKNCGLNEVGEKHILVSLIQLNHSGVSMILNKLGLSHLDLLKKASALCESNAEENAE